MTSSRIQSSRKLRRAILFVITTIYAMSPNTHAHYIGGGPYEYDGRDTTKQESLLLAMESSSPCATRKDVSYYGGVVLDCSRRYLERFDSAWIPPNTTEIRLDHNQLSEFPDNAFMKAPRLRFLDISNNNFKTLRHSWFRGIIFLQTLNASSNSIKLGNRSFTDNVFQHLPSLKTLDLGKNSNVYEGEEYPEFLLCGLPHLETLALDTFPGTLYFGPVFDNVTTLKSLTLTGSARVIGNNSFRGFEVIPLETLRFEEMDLLVYTELDAFVPFKTVKHISFEKVIQRLNVTLLSLKPFVGRHLVNLHFNKVGSNFGRLSTFQGSNVISKYSGQYLSEICVDKMSITSSDLLGIDIGQLMYGSFAGCLKSFNARHNPLYGGTSGYFDIAHFQNLTTLTLAHENVQPEKMPACSASSSSPVGSDSANQYEPHSGSDSANQYEPHSGSDSANQYVPHSVSDSANQYEPHSRKTPTFKTDKELRAPHGTINLRLFCNKSSESFSTTRVAGNTFDPKPPQCYRLPPSLQQAFIVSMGSNLFFLDYTVHLWPNKLKELYISRNGITLSQNGIVIGFDVLELLDISYNDGSHIRPDFFDYYPSLRTLLVRGVNFDIQFIAQFSARLFSNLKYLEALDIADNGLSLFSDDTFKTNKLRVLILANNRFKSIPFDLANTPGMCLLNMSYNSISSLSTDEMSMLDAQSLRTNGRFSLALEGNILSCGCSQFRFMYWLHQTRVKLDNGQGYPCMAENGVMSNTSEFRDLKLFWRQCNGRVALLISLIVFALMCFGFTAAVLLYHFKTRLAAYVHQVVLKKTKAKTPRDYPIGVCVEYSDRDATFACLPVRSFIEEDLGLSTFLRHRDLLAHEFRDSSISQAIHHSWRVLLIVTESYLTSDPWSFFTMKVAASSATVTNQSKVVLLVEAGLEKRIPMCLLKAAQEGSVVTMETNTSDVEGEMKAKLRKALVDQNDDSD